MNESEPLIFTLEEAIAKLSEPGLSMSLRKCTLGRLSWWEYGVLEGRYQPAGTFRATERLEVIRWVSNGFNDWTEAMSAALGVPVVERDDRATPPKAKSSQPAPYSVTGPA